MSRSNSSNRYPGAPLVIAAAVLWGTTGTSQALAPDAADPLVIGTLRLIVGGAGLLVIAVFRGVLRDGRPWPIGLTLATALLVATYQLAFFAAVASTGVALGTMVAIGSGPAFAGLLDLVILRLRPGKRWCGATFLAVFGCGLMLVSDTSQMVTTTGVILALGAGLSYALYSLTIKRLLMYHAPEAVLAVVFCLGALLMSPLLLRGSIAWVAEPKGLLVILHLGLLATALSYWLYARGLQLLPVSSAVSLALAEPLTAALLGLFFLHEAVSLQALIGMGFLLSGLVLLAWTKREAAAQVSTDVAKSSP